MAEFLKVHLETLFVLDDLGRILSTREPHASSGPLFMLVRSAAGCTWTVHSSVSKEVARELDFLAREEPPLSDLRVAPVHTTRYQSLLAGRVRSGPALAFPHTITQTGSVVRVEDEQLLNRHFSGWMPGEIRAGRAPVMAVVDHGVPVSVCFCARASNVAAEAGVETAPGFRGRGFGWQVTAAWAQAVRDSGRIPLYSTDWSNEASLALARKLGLEAYAVDWSIWD